MKLIPIKVSRAAGRQVLIAKKNSPHIFFGGGVIGVVASTIMACRATLKLEETVDEIQADITELKTSGLDQGNNRARVYISAGKKVGRLYGPSVLVGAVSIGALTGSHVQMTRRNAALTATLAAFTKAYDEYRLRVAEELGKEKELEIHQGVKEGKDNDGKKVKGVDLTSSPYTFVFNRSTSKEWLNDLEMNRYFIQCQQNMANHRLTVNGFVLLNDVLKDLGMERTTPGSVCGWVIDKNGQSPKGGDGYIDFGAFEGRNFRMISSPDHPDPSIWLDFNCDGVVNDLIDEFGR